MHSLAHLKTVLAGRYDIEREIGAGGMATVYLATDVKHSRPVAVKVLKPDIAAVLGVERFLTEIRVTATLQHPTLLPLFDSGAADGVLFYVMPYVAGESLRARLDRERQLPIDEAVHIATTVAGALDYAHANGVIHRDLKPENILLQQGEPVVADFGIALAVSNAGGQRVTQTGLSLGTPQYMSPEQATGDRVIDARADVYSLGAVTYEMLTGDPPHNGNTVQAVIARVLTERPQNVSVLRPAVPEHVAYAVEKSLEKLPADRWASAREFADVMQGRVTVTRTNAASRRLTTRERLRDPLSAVIAALTLIAVALGVVVWRNASRADDPIQFTIVTRGDETLEININPLAFSSDGRTIAYVGGNGIYIRTVSDLRPRLIPGTEPGDVPFFSPDGRTLGFYARGKLMRVPIDGGSPTEVAEAPVVNRASWTSDGTIVFSSRGTINVVPASGGTARVISRPDTARGEVFQTNAIVLGSANTIVYTGVPASGWKDASLGVTDIEGGRPVRLGITAIAALGMVEGHLAYVTADGSLMAVPFDVRGRKATGPPFAVGRGIRTAGANAIAALSASGSLVYSLEGKFGEMQLVWVDQHGLTQPILTTPHYYDLPRLSPDGKRLAVYVESASGRGGDYWIFEFATGTLSRLTADSASYEGEWLPDSRNFMYIGGRDSSRGIWRQPVDGSGPAVSVLAATKGKLMGGLALDPDGRTLAYTEGLAAGAWRLMVRRLDADSTTGLMQGFTNHESAYRFSPDGKWLAYMSSESGSDQVYVRPFPGPGPRVQVSVDGGSEPVWARDGRRLYYRDRLTGRQMYAARIATTPTFTVLDRTKLFEGNFDWDYDVADYDVSADGRFVMAQLSTTDEEIVVKLNWREELRRRLREAR